VDRYNLKVCDSTNDVARQFLADGVKVPFVVTADEQNRGKGQQNRRWVSEKGGLYTSFAIEKIDPRKALVSGALSVHSVVSGYVPSIIRFPNDIIVNGLKIAGVLVEQTVHATIIGIGINVNQNCFPDELAGVATSLSMETGAVYNLSEIMSRLLGFMKDSLSSPYEHIFNKYMQSIFYGKGCTIHLSGDRRIKCRIERIDMDLNVHTTSGDFAFEDIVWIESA